MIDHFKNIPIVISSGSSYEIGLHHGSAGKDRVQKSFQYNLKGILDPGIVTEKEAYKITDRFRRNVQAKYPEYIEEMQGIADGAGLRFEDIMLLNCRTELQKICWNKKDSRASLALNNLVYHSEACTSVAVTGERTVDGATYVGQNWDNGLWSRDCLIYHIIRQKNNKPMIAYCGEAGIISRSGMNSVGIGSGVNSLTTTAPVNLDGIPLQLLLRAVLDAGDLARAIDAVSNGKNGAINNIMIAHADGEAVDVEMDTDCCGLLYPVDGILVHTNHYCAPGHPRQPFLDRLSGSSFLRQNRCGKLLRNIPGKISLDDIQTVLSDHVNGSGSICRHPEETEVTEFASVTVMSFLCNLTTKEMRLAPGNPCEGYLSVKPFDLIKEA